MSTFNIVLFEPEIPENTGNIGRLCIATDAELHIIKPMRFLLTDKYLKRAGMDYWKEVKLTIHDDWNSFCAKHADSKVYLYSTKGKQSYHAVPYQRGDFLVFGPESRGLPEDLLYADINKVYRITMCSGARSLNLATSVGIVLYEGLRQNNFFSIV
jgi:tRNA (cytidine/uridine-2'-O-)-methyltransferase